MPKLFLASIEVEAYFLAEDAEDAGRKAVDYLREEFRNVCDGEASVREVAEKPLYLASNWEPGALVYGAKVDTTLGSIIDQLPAREGSGR